MRITIAVVVMLFLLGCTTTYTPMVTGTVISKQIAEREVVFLEGTTIGRATIKTPQMGLLLEFDDGIMLWTASCTKQTFRRYDVNDRREFQVVDTVIETLEMPAER